ncbi:hypothetical protein H9L39_01114 [Fusarium oxysporum f. sp. albedinis]|nr:hypothetical protein H9L39_01114 [Fusarium oxysporum f. sp. albedinis]
MGYSVSSETVDITSHWGIGRLGDAPKAVRAEKMLPIHAGHSVREPRQSEESVLSLRVLRILKNRSAHKPSAVSQGPAEQLNHRNIRVDCALHIHQPSHETTSHRQDLVACLLAWQGLYT